MKPIKLTNPMKAILKTCMVLSACLTLLGCDDFNMLVKSKNTNSEKKATQNQTRIDALKKNEEEINKNLEKAKAAWVNEDVDQLEDIYQMILNIDSENTRAREGLKNVAQAKHHLQLINEVKSHLNISDDEDVIAKAKLHQVLLERPQHPVAKTLYLSLIKKENDRTIERLHKKLSFNEPITLQFRDVNLKMILEALSKTSKINFILDKDIPSELKSSIYVDHMAFNDALDLLLQTNQLDKKVISDNSVIIYVNDAFHQQTYKDLTVRNFTLEYADIKQVTTSLKTMLNIKQIESDPRLNTILIKATPEVMALANKLIQSMDLPDPEVMLEMEVLEVSQTRAQKLGLTPPISLSVPINGALTLQELRTTRANNLLVGGNPALNFSANDSDLNLLANPKIRVKNKEVAKIHIGDKVPVFTSNASSTGTIASSVQYIDVGLKLEAEPTISASGDVTIKINLNVGSVGTQISGGGAAPSTAFKISTRSTSTQLRLYDGETQILAGLINDEDRKDVNKIPGIANFPLIGRLFANRDDTKAKSEIVLLITPRIIKGRKTNEAHQTEYAIGTEANIGSNNPSPRIENGNPIFIPKPNEVPPAPIKEDLKPQNLNLPLNAN
jgi:general secretion pathway protein D